jgi:hypothetical protein
MLNLSDKELDRISREAAQEHDPGDVIGPQSWERLEVRLDKDLGRVNPNPFRGIRRLPFLYAPAILLILGVGYYFVKQNKYRKAEPPGSPPVTLVNPQKTGEANTPANNEPSITKKPAANDNLISTPKASTTAQYSTTPGQSPATGQPVVSGQPVIPSPAGASSSSGSSAASNKPAGSGGTIASGQPVTPSPAGSSPGRTIASNNRTTTNKHTPGLRGHRTNAPGNRSRIPGNHTTPGGQPPQNYSTPSQQNDTQSAFTDQTASPNGAPAAVTRPRELNLSPVQQARSRRPSPAVDDAGLRTYTAKASPVLPLKKVGVLRINRSLQIGLSLAPDFASVNSLAGDRPGSTMGLTLDYLFANRWSLGTGLLLSRKNYAARAQDYHAPYDFYRANNLHNIDFVKGSFNMLEIPLNLRYDFSMTGNTVFFASAGLSSYFFASENCNYYFNSYGREDSKGFHYPNHENSFFTTANLSVGVEANISNSFSLLVAPYMKIPTRNMGFGQIQMNSVGINFALKFTPVLSRRRR